MLWPAIAKNLVERQAQVGFRARSTDALGPGKITARSAVILDAIRLDMAKTIIG